jgi:DNA-binding transcriptional regulator YbjK
VNDMTKPKPRTRDGAKRRRELCDAAIGVLAEHGSRGLSHERVDRAARLPVGSTSYYYRTRAALLRGVAQRVAEIDTANLQSVTDEKTEPAAPFGLIARLTMMQADGPDLMLNKTRHELFLAATRDPVLAKGNQEFLARIDTMAHDAVSHLQPNAAKDSALLDAQTTAVTTFLAGVLTRFIVGDHAIYDADQLARLLQSIATAVAQEHNADRATTSAPQ